MAEALGCYAEYVEEPEAIRLALQRAWRKVEEGMIGFVTSRPTTAPAPRPCVFEPRDLSGLLRVAKGAPSDAPLPNLLRQNDRRHSVVLLRRDLPEVDTRLEWGHECTVRRSERGNDGVDRTAAIAD